MFRLALPLLLATAVFAQTSEVPQPPAPAPNATPLGTADGRVSNAQTGAGIGGATVRFVPMVIGKTTATERKSATKPDGSFHLSGLVPGAYVVLASHSGFLNTIDPTRPYVVNVAAGQESNGISIKLTPGASVVGSVFDDQHHPVPKAIVAVLRIRSLHGIAQLHQTGSVMADASGRYSLPLLDPGSYYIVAGPSQASPDAPAAKRAAKLPLVRTFYPKAIGVDDAIPLQVTAGQDLTGINVTLVRAAQHRVRGIVDGFANLAPGLTTVTLSLRNGINAVGLNRTVKPGKSGIFEFAGILPGSYTLWLRGVDAGQSPNPMVRPQPRIITREDLDVGNSDIPNLSLPVMPPVALTGHISIEGSDNSKADLSHVHITLTALEDIPGAGVRSAQVSNDGSFSFKNLEPARYALFARNAPNGTYVQSISVGGQDVTHTAIDLAQGESGRIEIVLKHGAGEVAGSIEPGQNRSTAAATVILVPQLLPPDGSGLVFGAGRPGDHFTIRNVPPGQYYALAVARYNPAAWENTEFIHQVETEGTSIEVAESGNAQVQLPVIPVGRLRQAAARVGLSF